uniref:WD repeat-containing protein 90 n=1 Tax=Anolis carolinensis TaxID=28377 RepID=A0A803TYR9_ANOCA
MLLLLFLLLPVLAVLWQHPYLNVFKHFKVEEWKRSTKEGDVTTYMDKALKGTVYRISGAVPASNYLQLPKTSTQSLGLTGRYLYILFKPAPAKYFVVHLDVATEDSQVVRISFSNLFKEFKSTATWLQFPFICEAAKGSNKHLVCLCSPDLVGLAPSSVRWTCLMLDLRYILSLYLNRGYSHLKSVKLCANLLVKNLFTSDLLFDPVVTFSEVQQSRRALHGVSPMPREMAFPVPKGENWHDFYDYVRYVLLSFLSGVLYRIPVDFQRLLPDPILKLRKIIGFGGYTTRWALWAAGGSVVVYPCHALIIAIALDSGKQTFLAGHTDKVSALAFNGNNTLLASAQIGQPSMMRLWDFPTGKCLCMFKAGMHSVSCLSFSYSGGVLCGTGKDKHGKTVVVVWNTIQVNHGGEAVMLAKAHTDVDIHTIKIAFFDDTRMVSCGRDNVRLWRVRSGALRSCPVNLGEYRSLDFTDLDFEAGQCEPDDRTLFVCSRSGHVLEIDYKNVAVRNARRLMPTEVQHSHRREKQTFNSGPGIALNSICLSSSFCATASEDGYLRLWPLDFSEVFLEAEHDYPLSSVRISPDNLKVLCTTATGNVGCLDIQSKDYCTIMRSHTDSVSAFSVEGSQKQLVTVSQDNTIRIWNLESMQQLYEFTASDEMPCTVSFHPSQHIFACGFDTGVVRTISLATSKLLEEHKQHRGLITGLTFSPDGNFMYSCCSRGTLALYNCAMQKSHIVRVLGEEIFHSSQWGFIILLRIDVSILDLDSTALDAAMRLCFAPFPLGHLLVTTSSQKVLVLDAKTGRLIRMIPQVHKQSCSSLAMSPDARYLLTAGDRAIKVWDYGMRFDVNSQVFIGHSEPIRQVRFTPDQRQVISVGDAIFLWDFLESDLEELQEDVTSRATDSPRQLVPVPTVVSPPCLELSSIQRLAEDKGDNKILKLKTVIGYNGNGRGNMVWNPDTGFFAYSCGCVLIVEDLHSGAQQHWLGHPEEISTLAVNHDAQVLASASGQGSGDSRCQIRIWSVQDKACRKVLFHHETQVQAMAYSRDDRLFVTLGDYVDRVLALWNAHTYDLMSSTCFSEPVHDVAFSLMSVGHLACVGKGTVTFWLTEQQGADISLKVHKVPVPDAVGPAELTSLCYSTGCLLYTGTNTGQICAWDTETNRCFMTWEAVDGEIGILQCHGNRLVSGSNTKKIQLWSVLAVQELRVKGSSARSSSVLLEQEMTLDGTIVSAMFDNCMDMGIVGTTAGTLWYINWAENTSIRLISGHKNKVSEVAFSPQESHFATCGEDGSVRVWSLASMELVVQFQVLNQVITTNHIDHPIWSNSCLEGARADQDGNLLIIFILKKDGTHGPSVAHGQGMTFRVLTDHRSSPIHVIQCTRKQRSELGVEGGDLWLAASADRRVSVWVSDWMKDKCELIDWLSFPAPTGPEVPSPLPPSLAAFCPWDRNILAYVGYGLQKEILFYSLQQKQVIETIPLPSFAMSLSLSPAAKIIVVGFSERLLRLIDHKVRTEQDYVGHDDAVGLCHFTPSGKQLFTASYNEILVWEVQVR